ncbi:SDR family oxidoreductase [Nostoc sp. CENA67]|uniref:SDR family oxidoreductase n=1 Tax=Amazonocrinis nigriterrae CENA67 TaxID=2794033 RepID=A0A8J7HXC8_9NOST|nr:SDR family oxidoreductase [Amazonocrinis nigriterrae]MBH8565398.1 SDR family oxidoreductase [Amazonocrinis nigriterrae CENA67]
MELTNKIALITGASSGIGRETAKLFAEQGAKVAMADVDAVGGQTLIAQIKADSGIAEFYQVDVSIETEVQDLVAAVVNQWGGLDILVANAAVLVTGTVEEVTESDWDRVFAVNVKGYAFCAKYAAVQMRKRGGGAIINLASVSSFIAQPAFVPYNTTKGAILQLTRCLAYDLASDNIRVNCVCPGPIDTPAVEYFADFQGLAKKDVLEQLASLTLLKRTGEPREVANAILFLASDKASFITGTPLMVDGGYTAQ